VHVIVFVFWGGFTNTSFVYWKPQMLKRLPEWQCVCVCVCFSFGTFANTSFVYWKPQMLKRLPDWQCVCVHVFFFFFSSFCDADLSGQTALECHHAWQ